MSNFMTRAVELSIENVKERGGRPFGCVIVRNNEIIAEGSNDVIINNDPTAHAEVVCIRNACKKLGTFNLSDCELYTSCYPCPMCYGAIRWARITKTYYANSKEDAHNIGLSSLDIYESIINQKQELIKLDEPLAIQAFKIWTDKANKTEY